MRSTSDEDGKHPQVPARDTQLNGSLGDNLSDIDADVDLRSQMPLSGLPSRNEVKSKYKLLREVVLECILADI